MVKTEYSSPKCWCGCGRHVIGMKSRFKPGHDAKFHSAVRRVVLGELKLEQAIKNLPTDAVTAFRKEMTQYDVVEV